MAVNFNFNIKFHNYITLKVEHKIRIIIGIAVYVQEYSGSLSHEFVIVLEKMVIPASSDSLVNFHTAADNFQACSASFSSSEGNKNLLVHPRFLMKYDSGSRCTH